MSKQYYVKEEEFLEEFCDIVGAAVKLLEEWQPNYGCNDSVRNNQKYFFSTGELNALVFDSAVVHYDSNGFSSAQIIVKSSKRIINVCVKEVGGSLVAEKLIDKPQ